MFDRRLRRLALALCSGLLLLGAQARADGALHCLWELHGKHNTVYLLGSIHTLRAKDYPLAPAVIEAYRNSTSILMEINLADVQSEQVQSEMLSSAMLPEGKELPEILGKSRYSHAQELARGLGVELPTFNSFAPWFVAEAITQQQLTAMGFEPQSGVEMYFMERARGDGKSVAGLETVHDQIALFEGMSMNTQAEYLISSLEQAHGLPAMVEEMVRAWQRGDAPWFETQIKSEFGGDPALYQSLLTARNRKWLPKIESLLDADKNYLVIVGTGHLVGRDSVIDLLKRDGIGATQR